MHFPRLSGRSLNESQIKRQRHIVEQLSGRFMPNTCFDLTLFIEWPIDAALATSRHFKRICATLLKRAQCRSIHVPDRLVSMKKAFIIPDLCII